MESVLQFLYGGLAMMCAAIGVFLLNYWRHGQPRDRFFLWFMAAFWSLGASWSVHLLLATPSESGPHVYVLRVIAFLLIVIAIIDKNRRSAHDGNS